MKKRFLAKGGSGRADEGWAVISTLLSGLFVWGALGWLADHFLGTSFGVPVGLLVGMVLGIYAVVARYGRVAPAEAVSPVASDQSPWVAPFQSRLVHPIAGEPAEESR